MIENDLSIKILQGIRDDLQRSNRESGERFDAMRLQQEAGRKEQAAARAKSHQRFEVIATALRDVAEQLKRIAELEQRAH